MYAYKDTAGKRIGLITPTDCFAVIADLGDFYVLSIRGGSGFVEK